MATSSLIQVFTGTIQNTEVPMCDARTLHKFLGVKRDFTTWVKGRILKYQFVRGEDYLLTKTGENLRDVDGVFPKSGENSFGRGRPQIDYHLTLDMAKELAMVENNEKGREVRRYFIACERELLAQRHVAQLSAPYAVLPGQTISEEQADQLRETLMDAAQSLPYSEQKRFLMKGWSKLKAHFGVSYRGIPSQHFTDALSLIARHCAEASREPEAIPAKVERLFLSTVTPDGMVSRELSEDEILVHKDNIAAWVADASHHLSDKQLAEITQACAFRVASKLLPVS